MSLSFEEWRRSGAYLPEPIRDFHDQKDLFKAMDEVRERSIAKNGGAYMRYLSWSDAHVYTVDIFLWVMAGHGYTLQRSRRRFAFGDLYEFMGEAKRRWQNWAKTFDFSPQEISDATQNPRYLDLPKYDKVGQRAQNS